MSHSETGANDSGGAQPTGGVGATGGALLTVGGASATGGNVAQGARGAGICPGGPYPEPAPIGMLETIYADTAPGQLDGPVWFGQAGALLLSDMMSAGGSTPQQENIVKLDLTTSTPTLTTLVYDAGTNGLALDRSDWILGCSHGRQAIVAFDPMLATPLLTNVVSSILVSDIVSYFNSTNDLVVRSDGTIYFTDPTYHQGSKTPLVGTRGVYRVPPARTSVESIYGNTTWQPNGIALSPDERSLYVVDSQSSAVYSFPLDASGMLDGPLSMFSSNIATPDGATVDCAGNVYVTSKTPNGYIRIISPTGATKLEISAVSVSNVAFGGPEHKTLYMTAGRSVYALSMNIPGMPD